MNVHESMSDRTCPRCGAVCTGCLDSMCGINPCAACGGPVYTANYYQPEIDRFEALSPDEKAAERARIKKAIQDFMDSLLPYSG